MEREAEVDIGGGVKASWEDGVEEDMGHTNFRCVARHDTRPLRLVVLRLH